MSNYRHILVAVDVTEEAVDVLARAMLIAQKNDATLSLITVVRPLTYAYTGIEVAGLAAAAIDFERQAKASVEKTLSRLCEAEPSVDGAAPQTVLRVGGWRRRDAPRRRPATP